MDYNNENNYTQFETEPQGNDGGDKTEKKKSKAGKIVFGVLILLVVLVVGIGIGTLLSGEGHVGDGDKKSPDGSSESAGVSLDIADSKPYEASGEDGVLSTVEIAEKVSPSVVGVWSYYQGSQLGEGSAVVMGEDDTGEYTYFVTCAHIVNTKGVSAKIVLEDETTYDADIIGYDTRTDIAVLRVKATGFTGAEFGDSTVLKVGEPVYAIGNPGGMTFYDSFTGGYVSAIDRPTASSESAYSNDCIQHDAAINPGNSGGALVNSYGQVVGINSSKIADEEYEGMGFAVPISVVKEVVDDIISSGYVTNRAMLGISYVSVSNHRTYYMIAKMNDLPSGSIVIAEIQDGSSFDGTDVIEGDIIVAVDGEELSDEDVLLDIIEDATVGTELSLTIARVNQDYTVEKFDVTIKLVEDKGTVVPVNDSNGAESGSEGFTNPFAN